MIKSRIVVNEAEVKKFNDEQKDWVAFCRLCHKVITGSLVDLRGHVCGK